MDENPPGVRSLGWAETTLLFILSAIILWLAIEAWFDPLQFRVLAGDDLRTFARDQMSLGAEIMRSASGFQKFRPVTTVINAVVVQFTKGDFREIASIGLAIHAANAMIFFWLLYRTIRLPLALSIGVTAIAVFNRFATYLFMQEQALMEGMGVTFLLLGLIMSSAFLKRPTIRYALVLTLLFAFLTYAHERFIVLALPLALLGAGSFRFNRGSSVTLVGGVAATALCYLCLKKFWLGAPILVGTGGRLIEPDPWQIGSFLWQGTLNLLGINRGPEFLSLEDFSASPFWIQFVSVAAAIASCCLLAGIVSVIIRSPAGQEKKVAFLELAFYLSTIAVLLISASITFRQEHRWLYAPFLAFLSLLGVGVVQMSGNGKRWARLALTALLLLSLCREIYLARRHSHFYAFESYQIADNLFATLQNMPDASDHETIFIRGNVPSYDWTFMAGTFSTFYRLPSLTFGTQSSAFEQTDAPLLILDYVSSDRTFKVANAGGPVNSRSHRMGYSLLERPTEALTPDSRSDTPTKTPVFPWSKDGVNCMVLAAPVEMAFPVPQDGGVLYLCFSHMMAKGDGADIEIAALGPAGRKVLLSRAVPPLTNDDLPVWRKYEFALPVNTQQVTLRVFSKTDALGDWIGLRDFSFDVKNISL